MQTIYDVFDQLGIAYEKHVHPAVFTVAEAEAYDSRFEGGKSKNLFLRNKKGDKHFLLVAESTRKVDLKKVSEFLGESKLSFASPERLMTYLGVTPGSVSPFALINNADHTVRVLIDSELMKHTKLGFHPNVNTATLVVSAYDFKKFLHSTGNSVSFIDL